MKYAGQGGEDGQKWCPGLTPGPVTQGGILLDRDIQEIKVVCFRLGQDTFALDIMRVKEIIKPLKLSGLPEAPSFVEGVINLRGSIIPVVDLRKRFGYSDCSYRAECRLLITVVARQLVGLIVDAVTEVVTIQVRELRPAPSVAKLSSYRYLIGVCLVKDVLVMLVNPDKIFSQRVSNELQRFSTEIEAV